MTKADRIAAACAPPMSTTTNPIPTREPQVLSAGDTTQWIRALVDYPSPTWTLKYVLRGPAVYSFSATASGGNHLVTIESATSAKWKPGFYKIGAIVTDGTNQVAVTTFFERIILRPNLALTPEGVDARSWAERTLAVLEQTIADILAHRVSAASVNGQSYTLADIDILQKIQKELESRICREQYAARLNAGLGAGNKIGIRFRPLTYGFPPSQRVPWQ